jgi:hypothetical protein
MRLETRSQVALYVWDYFYISNVPRTCDHQAWSAIERATCRIYESEPYLDPPTPADLRLREARRVRNAARVALRQIKKLSVAPERWVIDGLEHLEALSDTLIHELSKQAEVVLS